MTPCCLVIAKAPVPGLAKTRLGDRIGMEAAADLAAAALLDTLSAAGDAFGPGERYVALAGSLDDAARAAELRPAMEEWTVFAQVGETFADRLAHAHVEVARRARRPVVQIGMDTAQVTGALLLDVAAGLGEDDAVLGPAEDGGWWVLALRDPRHGAVLSGVPASTPETGARTRSALTARGLSVGTTTTLRDVDEVADAEVVARTAPDTRFAATWAALAPGVRR